MDKVVLPFILFTISIGLFFSYIRPAVDVLKALNVQEERVTQVLKDSKDFEKKRDALLAERISKDEDSRLKSILPDTIDVVRFIIHLDDLAKQNGILIRSFTFPRMDLRSSGDASADDMQVMNALFTLDVETTYDQFKSFLMDIEKSAALMDVVSLNIDVPAELTIVGGEKDRPVGGSKKQVYTLGIQRYWLQ